MERLLSVNEVADLLGVKTWTVYEWAETRDEARRLPSVKVGRLRKFRVTDLEAWVDARAE